MKKTLILLLSAAVCLACGEKNESAQAAATTTTQTATAAKYNLPPDHPPMGNAAGAVPASNTAAAPAAAPGGKLLTGTVAETMNAGGYTYVKVKTAGGDVWAAVQQTQTKVGEKIAINAQMTLDNFKSETLNRTFDHIVFGTVASPNAPAAAPAAAQNPHGAPAPVPANIGDVKVAKAEGADAKTVAELWAAGPSVKDKSVTLRGKVVKFLPEIMGKNWIHLRDGSGSDAKKDNDITVVTKDVAAVGDVVVVKGTVRVDKDFGAGYKYPVIIEDAKVTK